LTKVSENDYYVASDDELSNPTLDEHTRYFATKVNDDGRNAQILSFDEFLTLILQEKFPTQ
jgi:hypothetical protein